MQALLPTSRNAPPILLVAICTTDGMKAMLSPEIAKAQPRGFRTKGKETGIKHR